MLRLSKILFKAIEEWGGEGDGKGSGRGGGSGGWGNGPWEIDLPEKQTDDNNTEGAESVMANVVDTGNDNHHLRTITETGALVDIKNERKRMNNADSDNAGQGSMTEGERAEWEQVVKLSKTLVEDFGRLPFAGAEWEEVRAILLTESGESEVGTQEGGNNAPLNGLPGELNTGVSNTTTVSTTSGADQPGDAGTSREGRADSLLSAAVKKAKDLKARGNDKFRTGNLDESLGAYSEALDELQQVEPHASETIGSTGSIGGVKIDQSQVQDRKQQEVCSTLRGVLHRNRAAVLLSMFDHMVEAPRQAKHEMRSSALHKSPAEFRGARMGISSVSAGHVYSDRQKARNASSEAETEEKRVKVVSMQLLEQCEADCLRALELDATDKKARFRLARCRELQQQEQANRRAATATNTTATVTDGCDVDSR